MAKLGIAWLAMYMNEVAVVDRPMVNDVGGFEILKGLFKAEAELA